MNGRDKTDHNLHKRAKCVEAITLPHDWPGDIDFLDVWRAGNKNNGYAYGLTTFSGEGTFRFVWLDDDERVKLITALGGRA